MISIIIPVYNAGQYLNSCVDSILRSTYQDFELLLINDGSTDASPQICADYAALDHRVKLINQENQGVSAARNRGLEAVRPHLAGKIPGRGRTGLGAAVLPGSGYAPSCAVHPGANAAAEKRKCELLLPVGQGLQKVHY